MTGSVLLRTVTVSLALLMSLTLSAYRPAVSGHLTSPEAQLSRIAMSDLTLVRKHPDLVPHTPFYRIQSLKQELVSLKRDKDSTTVELVIDSPSRLAALTRYSEEVGTKQAFHHQFLSPFTMDQRFGASPAMVSEAKGALAKVGWHVVAFHGFIATVEISANGSHSVLPVSPYIWACSGLSSRLPTPQVVSQSRFYLTRLQHTTPYATTLGSLSAYGFRTPPTEVQQQLLPNGDVVNFLSWNPGFTSSLPSGLPWTLIVTAQDSQGQPVAITDISNITDSAMNIAPYSLPNGSEGLSLPDSHQDIWQLELASLGANPHTDTLSMNISLNDAMTSTVSVTLPPFTGNATPLNPLTGPEINQLTGAAQLVSQSPASNRPPIAIYTQGQIPSMSDVGALMQQEGLPIPVVQFRYFDGANASMMNSADFSESTLDTEAVASVDPGSTIQEYVFPPSDANAFITMLSALSQQTTDKIALFTYGLNQGNAQTASLLIAACNAEGITVVYSAGDKGAWDSGLSANDSLNGMLTVGGLDISAPATFDNNGSMTAVYPPAIVRAWGGDYMNGLPNTVAQAYANENMVSTGGFGSSPLPSWQQDFLPQNAPGIGVPDVSSLAGVPGFSLIQNGQPAINGGTSLAAALTAGWIADLEGYLNAGTQGLGNINPTLYQIALQDPQDFSQASWGSNGIYQVTSSNSGTWNPVTGLGQPNWGAIARTWASSNMATQFSIKPSTTTVGVGQSMTFQVTAENENGTPIANYAFPISVTSSDPNANFSGEAVFKNGMAQITGTFGSTGSETITVSGPNQVSVTSPPIMVKNLVTQVSPPNPNVGQEVTLTATAYELPNPTFQFWIYNPATQQWSTSGAYSSTNTFNVRESIPGNYTAVVYEKPDGATSPTTEQTVTFTYASLRPMVSGLSVSGPNRILPIGSNATIQSQAVDVGGVPLYQFWLRGPNNRWVLAQNFGPQNTLSLGHLQAGSYAIVVDALNNSQVAQKQWDLAYHQTIVVYVGSRVNLSVSSPKASPVTISATADGITDPVFQFWIESPAGQWQPEGPYGSSTVQTQLESPGVYTIAVYAKDPYAPDDGSVTVSNQITMTVP